MGKSYSDLNVKWGDKIKFKFNSKEHDVTIGNSGCGDALETHTKSAYTYKTKSIPEGSLPKTIYI